MNDTQAASKMMNVSAFGTSDLWKVMNVSALPPRAGDRGVLWRRSGHSLAMLWLCWGYASKRKNNKASEEREDIEEREERTNMIAGRRRSPRAGLCRQTTNSTHIEREHE